MLWSESETLVVGANVAVAVAVRVVYRVASHCLVPGKVTFNVRCRRCGDVGACQYVFISKSIRLPFHLIIFASVCPVSICVSICPVVSLCRCVTYHQGSQLKYDPLSTDLGNDAVAVVLGTTLRASGKLCADIDTDPSGSSRNFRRRNRHQIRGTAEGRVSSASSLSLQTPLTNLVLCFDVATGARGRQSRVARVPSFCSI